MKTFETTRFGTLNTETIPFPEGILGFENSKEFALVDPVDSTNILWLQSVGNSGMALPVIPSNIVDDKHDKDHYYVLTIPQDITKMTVNTKAPIVIKSGVGNQIIAKDGECNKPIYLELKRYIINN